MIWMFEESIFLLTKLRKSYGPKFFLIKNIMILLSMILFSSIILITWSVPVYIGIQVLTLVTFLIVDSKINKETKHLVDTVFLEFQDFANIDNRNKKRIVNLKNKIEFAKKIQNWTPDKKLMQIGDVKIHGKITPSDIIGGDFFDIISNDKTNNFIFWIGDVSGHDLESGIIMSWVQTIIKTLVWKRDVEDIDIRQLFITVNDIFYREKKEKIDYEYNVSMIFCKYVNGNLYFCGQNEPLLFKHHNTVTLLPTGDTGFPIGIIPDISHLIHVKSLYINKNDALMLYTDGITEYLNGKNQRFGINNLMEIFLKTSHLYEIMDYVYKWGKEIKFQDDASIVILERLDDDDIHL